jgi:hypothetical protein
VQLSDVIVSVASEQSALKAMSYVAPFFLVHALNPFTEMIFSSSPLCS